MKTLIICLIFVFISSTKIYCQGPCYYEAISLNLNMGFLYHLVDGINGNLELGGPAEIKSHSGVSYFGGIGILFDKSWHYLYGIDFNISGSKSSINEAILNDIRGINKINDTIPIITTGISSYQYLSLIISPVFTYRVNTHLSFSVRPQIIFSRTPEIHNTFTLSDTNFTNFIGKPEITRKNNNEINNQYNIIPKDFRNFDINLVLSLDYKPFEHYQCDDCCPAPEGSFYRFDLLIGLSQINPGKVIIYPGLSVKYTFPIWEKHYSM